MILSLGSDDPGPRSWIQARVWTVVEEAGLPHQLHLLITTPGGLLSFRIGAEIKNGNDFSHLRAQFTTEIAFHLIQAATDSAEHLNKIKQDSFTF